MRSPDYTRLALQLPAVFHEDVASFAQVDAYLGLADELSHAIIEEVEDLSLTLGPDASLRWPATLPLDAGSDALLTSYLATYDEIATWASFAFPASWGDGEDGVLKRRAFLAKSARLWRRRGTPRGFLDWLCFAFDIAPANRPLLIEHFKVRPTPPAAAVPDITDPDLAATLLVVATAEYADFRNRQELVEFVDWYAPSHIAMRVCWVTGFTGLTAIPAAVAPLPEAATTAQENTYRAAVNQYRANIRAIICSIVSVVDHANGIHVFTCIDEGRSIDRLDVGLLPT